MHLGTSCIVKTATKLTLMAKKMAGIVQKRANQQPQKKNRKLSSIDKSKK